MKKYLLFVVAALLVSIGLGAPSITNVVAQQQSPGRVDIGYEVVGNFTVLPTKFAALKVMATDMETGLTYAASSLSGDMELEEGMHSLVWDMAADGLSFTSSNVIFSVSCEIAPCPYLVIDLSAGESASHYPCAYLAAPPDGGFTYEYQTTKLVLRRIEPGTFNMCGEYETTLTKPYYIGVSLMTQKQYELIKGLRSFNKEGDARPVDNVVYTGIRGSSTTGGLYPSNAPDSDSVMGRLRTRTGLAFDLPTEAQWECAFLSGTTSYWDGNIIEWCLDVYGLLSNQAIDPISYVGYNGDRSNRVVRKGNWRGGYNPTSLYVDQGFRIAWTLGSTTEIAVYTGISESTSIGMPNSPSITPNGGIVANWPQSISISCDTDGAEIHYTTDGSDPTAESPVYCSFLISERTIVKAVAILNGNASEVAVAEFAAGQCADTDIIASSTFTGSNTKVSLSCTTPGATIHYTLNGNDPNEHSTCYTEPFYVTNSCTVKAYATYPNYFDSTMAAQSITKIWGIGDTMGAPDQAFATNGDLPFVKVTDMTAPLGESMKSGAITNNQTSILSTTVSSPGTVSFQWKASCEDSGGEYECDHAEFEVDGVVVARLEGVTEWQTVSHKVMGDGLHTLTWRYVKDNISSEGGDCCYVSDYSWTVNTYSVKFSANGGGGTMPEMRCLVGVTTNIPPCNFRRDGYDFAGWEIDGRTFFDGADITDLTVDDGASVTLTAKWTKSIGNALYLVIDISGGHDATNYPVTFLDQVPDGGWTEEYKTRKIVLRKIPHGTFMMGSPGGENAQNGHYAEDYHEVTLSKDLYMGVFEFTQSQWTYVMGDNPSICTNALGPVDNVSYDDIRGANAGGGWPTSNAVDPESFLGRLRLRTGLANLDLPTEAQWEYVCRAGTTTDLNSGKNLDYATHGDSLCEVGQMVNHEALYEYIYAQQDPSAAEAAAHEAWAAAGHDDVGSYLPNTWGVYDMHGGVWEWCLDWWKWHLGTAPVTDPVGAAGPPIMGQVRLIRGGSWSWDDDLTLCRSAWRYLYYYGIQKDLSESPISNAVGFRLCLTVDDNEVGVLAPLDVEVNGCTGVYDGSGHGVSVAVTVPGEGALVKYALSENGPFSGEKPFFTNVCEQTVWVEVSADNYVATKNSATVKIDPRPLTIVADAKSKTYGEADPALTYTATGLVEGDTITGELVRDAGEDVGTYAIGQGTLTAGENYAISYTGAVFTIETWPDSGRIAGSDLLWSVSGTTLTISGDGPMPWHLAHDTALYPYQFHADGVTEIVIDEGVTYIGEYAFSMFTNVTAVSLPASLEAVGLYAFGNCMNIEQVNIASVESWCGVDFGGISSNPMELRPEGCHLYLNGSLVLDLVIPDGVTQIPDYAFCNCRDISSVTIPASVSDIGECAFYGDSNLSTVRISEGLEYIGPLAFSGTRIESFKFPDSLLYIGKCAFQGVPIGAVSIKSGYVGECAFADCGSMWLAYLGKDVVVDENAFQNCPGIRNTVRGSTVTVPATFTMGSYDGAVIEWQVLDMQDGVAFVVSTRVLGCALFNETPDRNAGGWAQSDIRAWLNGEFFNGAFTAQEKETIFRAAISTEDNAQYGTPGCEDTEDDVFLLSAEEIEACLPTPERRAAKPPLGDPDPAAPLGAAGYYWLRTPGVVGDFAMYVDEFGHLRHLGANKAGPETFGVRPAMMVDAEALGIRSATVAKTTSPGHANASDADVYDFVARFYSLCLDRAPDQNGLNTWAGRLSSGTHNGAMAAFGFFFSAEMERRNLSNGEFVEVLYNALMGRAPDASGKAYWVNLLDNGISRRGVFRGFAESAEFTGICNDYGIVRGSVDPKRLEERDKNRGVTMFVARCYTKALNRNYDVKGLNSWSAKINSSSTKKATAIQVAKSFLNSKEFKNRNLSNSAYVDVLYQTFFDRNPDTNGKNKWLGQLNSGVSRDKVMASFYNSAEFNTIMASYGIR